MPEGVKRMVSGRVERFREQLQIVHPDHMLPQAEFDKLPVVEPVYPLTAGLSAKVLMKAIQAALPQVPELPEWQEEEWLKKQGWSDWRSATQAAHRLKRRRRWNHAPGARAPAYDELLAHQWCWRWCARPKKQQGRAYQSGDELQRACGHFALPAHRLAGKCDKRYCRGYVSANAHVAAFAGRCRQRQDRGCGYGHAASCGQWRTSRADGTD